ncbi:putative ankyrin repeat-containing domain, PGG domain, ankyrin repeat-containing domain superfamily [Helianthus anomalus]
MQECILIALEIVKKYPTLCTGSILRVLACKPEAFHETQSNIIDKAIKFSQHLYSLMFIRHQPYEEIHLEAGNRSAPEDNHPEAGNGNANGSAPEDNHPEAGNGSAPDDNHPEAGNGSAPEDLTQNPEASLERKSNSTWRTIKSVYACIGLKVGAPQKESNALLLLRFIWGNIAKKPKNEIGEILRGPADLIMQDNKIDSGWAIQVMQLQKLISEHVDKMAVETTTKHLMELQSLLSEHLVEMHAEIHKIIKGPPNLIKQDNEQVSNNEDQALELQNLIFKHIASMHDQTQKIIKNNILLEDQVSRLRKVIFEHIEKLRKETEEIITKPRLVKKTHSSRVLFIAAEMGNTNFLVELIRQYPDLIWKVNDDNQTIFHIAVKHRHEGIYNLLYEIGAMKDLITPLKDSKENNMLHLVGKIVKQKRLEDVSGVALQMQRELLWFHEVKNMIPSSYRERKNKDGLTPHELFRMEHKELVTQGEQWLKGTANRCMVVAALIVTIVFATAFTVPGGYSQTNGIPFFHSEATFMIFVVADAISLFLSTASILIFLSILTSRYAESDFLESLPKKLISGLLTLFLSITTMTVAFGISFFVLYHKGLIWIPILICVFAVLPALLYVWLQYGLFFDVIRSTYRSRYLFKPEKRVLYYRNPMM